MEKIQELIEQLSEAIFSKFGEATNASVSIYADGYRNLSVEKMQEDTDKPVDDWKRRMLYDACKIDDEWLKDRSAHQNTYYKRNNMLLEEENT